MKSEPFRIGRGQLVLIAAEQYTRRFWPIFIAFPIFGLIALFFGSTQGIQAFGMICLAWPLSIPARSVFITSKIAKKFDRPVVVRLEDRVLYFSAGEGGMKLPLEQVRKVEKRKGFYIFETRMLNMVPVPVEAFAGKEAAFEKAVGL